MSGESYSLFPTKLGVCAIAWREAGIVLVRLPSKTENATRVCVLEAFPRAHEAAPPPLVASAVNKITAAIRGERADLSDIALDETGLAAFPRRVYLATRAIPLGATLTYGEVAARAGDPEAAQAVGQCLGANPFTIVVPCHRVIGADGKMIGFSATGGVETKRKLLEIEGVFALDKLPLFGGDQ